MRSQVPQGLRAAAPHRKTLHADSRLSLSLAWYPPGFRQSMHSHAAPSLALLLWGAAEEETGSNRVSTQQPSLFVKPLGVRHANRFGRDGAMLLSMTVHDPDLAGSVLDRWRWRQARPAFCAGVAAALRARSSHEDIALSLLEVASNEDDAPRRPPLWLRRARKALHDQPDVGIPELARSAGVHRVHLSRAFAAYFGETISLFRRRRRLEIAVRARLHEGASGTQAAHEAGFSDHSHLARTLRTTLGMSLTQLEGLLR